MKLSQAIEGFLLFKHTLSPNTLLGYRVAFRKLQDYLDTDPDIDTLTPEHIAAFFVHLRDTPQAVTRGVAPRTAAVLSGKSRRNIHVALSSLWTWSTENGYTVHHILRNVSRPKAEKRTVVELSKEDVRRLLSACDSYTYTRNGKLIAAKRVTRLRDKAIILTLLDTGIRASELCGLTIQDIDARNCRIKFGKGSKERTVRISPNTSKAIWHYLTTRPEHTPSEPLFSNHETTTPITRRNLLTLLSRIGALADVSEVHPHRFRHTFAIEFLRNGGNIYALQEILGHASLDMCKRYLGIAQADTEAAHKLASPVAHWKL